MPTVFIPKSAVGFSGNGNDQGNNDYNGNRKQTNIAIPRPTVYIPKEMEEEEKAKEQESLAAKRAAGKPVLIFDTKTGTVDLEEGTYSKVPLTAEISASTDRERLKQIMKEAKFSDQKTFRQAQQRLHDLDLYGAPGEEVSWNNALPYHINKGIEGIEDFFRNFYNQGSYRFQQRQNDMLKLSDEIDNEQIIKQLEENKIQSAQKQAKVNELFDLAPRDQRTAKGAWALSGEVAHSIGNMVPTIAANVFAPGSGLPLMGIGAMGGATHEAMQDGAKLEDAITYGMASGAVEVATEKMFDGIPGLSSGHTVRNFADKIIDKVIKKEGAKAVAKKVVNFLGTSAGDRIGSLIDESLKTETGKAIAKRIVDIFGEGAEEYISEVAGEYLTDIYKNDKPNESISDYVNRFIDVQPAAFQAGFLGALTSGVMQGFEMGGQVLTGHNPLSNTVILEDQKTELSPTSNLDQKPSVEIPAESMVKDQGANNIVMQPQRNVGLSTENLGADVTDAISAIGNANEARVQPNRQLISNDINNIQSQTIENNSSQLQAIDNNVNQPVDSEAIPQTTQFKIDSLKSKNTAIRFQAQRLNKKAIFESAKKIGGFNQTEIETIAEISNATGVPVQFVESLEYGANGMYKNGTIFISKGTKNPAKCVLVHEMTHHIENSGMYDQFSVAVQAIAKANHWDLAKMKENIINQYEKVSEGKVQLDETDAIKELNARIAEEYLFKDEKSIRLLATKNRNLAQKILDWIRETLSKLFGSQSSEAKSYTDQLRECEKLYRRAIEDAKADNNLDAQYMFGGLNAKEIPDGYEEAQNSTEDTETTWKKTGWVKKADGKWRFEIDDSKAQFNTALLKLFGEVDLEDVMAHPTLYKHYPSLKSYTVELLEGAPNNINGGFNSQQKKIRINANTLREGNFESTLIHEIQHAIQEQEGFESGSNIKKAKDSALRKEEAKKAKLGKFLSQNAGIDEAYKNFESSTKGWGEALNSWGTPQEAEVVQKLTNGKFSSFAEFDKYTSSLRKSIAEKYGDNALKEYENLLNEKNDSNYIEEYMDNLGEVEARDASNRRNLASSERINKLPETKGRLSKNTEKNETIYSLDPINEKNVDMYSQEELSQLEKNKKILILGKDIEFDEYIENSLTGKYNNDQRYLYIGKVKESLAEKIKQLYNYDISGFSITMNSSEVLHSINQHGYDLKKEISKGNSRTLSKDDFKYMTDIINNFDYSDFGIDKKSGNHALTLFKKIGEDNLACVELISNKKHRLTLKTMYAPQYIKKRTPTTNANASIDAEARTSETVGDSGFNNIIANGETNDNKKMSLGKNSDIIEKTEVKPEELSKNIVSYNNYKRNLKSKLFKDFSTETNSSNIDSLIDSAAIDVLKDSKISDETKDRLFNEIWSNSYVPDSEMDADYQQLLNELRGSKIKVNRRLLASEIPDHKEIVKSLKNIVSFSEKEGINIDQRYQELKTLYPQLEDVSHAGDQVRAIADLVESLKPETHHISDAYGYTKDDLRADLNEILQDFESEIIYRSDKSYYDKVAKKQYSKDLASGRPTSKAYEDATKEVLSEAEAGDQITEQFDAKGLAGMIKNYGSPNKTTQQNLDIVADGNKEVRRKLYDVFEKPMEIAKKGFVKWKQYNVNKLYTKVVKELGIKKGSKESAAVQWYGEGQRQIKVGSEKVGKGILAREQDIYRIEPYSLSDLQKDFPNKWQDIVKADRIFRGMYDEYVGRMNATLEKIYTEESLKQQVKDKQNELMAKINYQKTMLKALNEKVAQLKANDAKPEDIASAIAEVSKANAMIRASENQFAKISDNVYKNKRLKPRKDYYRHFQELSMADSLLDIFNSENDQGVSNQLAGISEFTKPKSRWASFMQRRDGNSHYTEDAVAGMLNYIPIAEHKIAFDPVVAKYRGDIQQLVKASDDLGVENTRFINWLSNYTNDLAGKTNYIDRVLANTNNGRKTLKVMKKINGKVKGNAVMGNLNSAVSQFYNLPNALGILTDRGGVKASSDITKGMKDYTAYVTQKLSSKYFNQQTDFESSPINQSMFLQERFMDDIFSKFDEGTLNKLKDFSAWTLQFGDQAVAESMWFAAYEQGQRLNVENPVTYADDVVRRAVAGRGVGEIPLTQKSEIVKLVAPFQVEVNNAWQMMKQMGFDKKFVPLLAIFITTWFMNNLNEKLTGNRVGMDLIDAMDDVINNGANPVGRVAGEIVSNAPFGAQGAAFLGLSDKDSEKFFGEADPTRYGVGNVGLSALSRPLVKGLTGQDVDWQNFVGNFVTPFGGKQLERTYKFLEDAKVVPDFNLNFGKKPSEWFKAMERGSTGSYDSTGKLKYPINTKDPLNFAAGMLFGSGATKEGRAFAKEDYRTLSDKQTGLYHQMVEMGVPQMAAYKSFFDKKYSQNVDGIENSKSILNREIYEKYGTLDAIKKIIESDDNPNGESAKEREGEIDAGAFGMNKAVLEMTEEEYQAELKRIRKMIEEMGMKEGK